VLSFKFKNVIDDENRSQIKDEGETIFRPPDPSGKGLVYKG
jgi:hypothetical protein